MDRALGSYLGLAVGDALGATVEFMTAGEIATQYRVHRQMVGGGWLRLKAGQVTDDTQMCLALGRAILVSRGWNLQAVANAYVDWMRSKPVDIGNTCRRGLRRFMQDGSLCGRQPCEEEGGNGAAMRNLPVALATLGDEAALVRRSIEQAHLTHWHPLSDAATVMLGRITQRLLLGGTKAEVRELADELVSEHRQFAFAPWPGRTSGYIVDTVQTVFDGFFSTADFESCLIRVVNRGGDADTTGALAGQLAGALYGVQAIPGRWIRQLDRRVNAAIRTQSADLVQLAPIPALPSLGERAFPAFLHHVHV